MITKETALEIVALRDELSNLDIYVEAFEEIKKTNPNDYTLKIDFTLSHDKFRLSPTIAYEALWNHREEVKANLKEIMKKAYEELNDN